MTITVNVLDQFHREIPPCPYQQLLDYKSVALPFIKWTCPTYVFGTIHYQFWGYQDENFKIGSQQYRDWSDCTDVEAGLALYWWQKLMTMGSSRVSVQ